VKNLPKVLVVDDQPVNVKLLQRKLERAGMVVLTAFRGEQALKIAEEQVPNIILLDIMMPEVDGFEVCRRLKEKKGTKDIPVIFITAKTSREGKLKGLGTGAADYITKPIDLDETIARVNTQLHIQENHRQNLELQGRLAEMRKQAAVGHVVEGIAHNLNNLLGVIVGYLDLMRNSLDSPERLLRSSTQLENGVKRMVDIVRQLTLVAEFDHVKKSMHSLEVVIENAIRRFNAETQISAPVKLTMHGPDVDFETNAEMLESVIVRLLTNAWESYDRLSEVPEERGLAIETESGIYLDAPCLHIRVLDEGCGIAEEMIESVFDPFVTTEPAVGRGMGLTISRHSLRTLGGDIRMEPRPGGGMCVLVIHPLGESSPKSLSAFGSVSPGLPQAFAQR
jgi:two-component system, sensor histidine kinase and response regulator